MPIPKVADEWGSRVCQVAAENPGKRARVIYGVLKERWGEPEGFLSEKSVQRILEKKWDKLSDEEKAGYSSLRWPGSMISGALAWDAGPAALELLRLLSGWNRPPIRLAKWFAQITASVPDAPPAIRLSVAQQLASQEAAQGPDFLPDASIEMYLIHKPWESDEAQDHWRAACESAGVKPFSHPTADLPPDADLDTIVEAVAIQAGGYPRRLKGLLKQILKGKAARSVQQAYFGPTQYAPEKKKEDDSEERE